MRIAILILSVTLRRIIASKSMQKHSPGTWQTAKEVVERIEAESNNE